MKQIISYLWSTTTCPQRQLYWSPVVVHRADCICIRQYLVVDEKKLILLKTALTYSRFRRHRNFLFMFFSLYKRLESHSLIGIFIKYALCTNSKFLAFCFFDLVHFYFSRPLSIPWKMFFYCSQYFNIEYFLELCHSNLQIFIYSETRANDHLWIVTTILSFYSMNDPLTTTTCQTRLFFWVPRVFVDWLYYFPKSGSSAFVYWMFFEHC